MYIGFWSLYGPLAVATWYYEKASLLKLSIVLLIGLGIALFGLWLKRRLLDRPYLTTAILPEEPEKARLSLPNDDFTYLDNVFKPDFGRVEIDLY
jgi:hypothetical protein